MESTPSSIPEALPKTMTGPSSRQQDIILSNPPSSRITIPHDDMNSSYPL